MESRLPRHERLDDLLAASDDPSPRRTRRVEWVGEKSPYDDPAVVWGLLTGYYSEEQKRLIRLAAARARTRVHRNRLFEHDHQHAQAVMKGLQRTYLWCKENNFVCDVDYHDVDVIFGSDCAHEFVDLDARERDEPKVVSLPVEIVVVSDIPVAAKDVRAGSRVASD